MLDGDQELLNQETETETLSQEDQSTDTTTSAETGSSEADAHEVNRTLLQEFGKTQKQLLEAQQQLAEINSRMTRQESRTTEEEDKDPLDDPDIPEFERKRHEKTREIIQYELRKTTKPLNDNARELKRKSDLADVKAALAAHEATAGMYEAVKDEFDVTLNGLAVLDPNLIYALLQAAYGKAAYAGKLPNKESKKEREVPTNGSLPNTRRTTPAEKPTNSKLTESDRVLMKKLGIKDEAEYIELRDGDGDVTSMVENENLRRKAAKK